MTTRYIPGVRTGTGATFWYLAATIAMTWPLAAGLSRDIPWDLGDSLLNCWILNWDADHLIRFLSGDLGAWRGYWSANIFYPEPLTIAYSEDLLAQAVQILPIYALSRNIVLSYNVLFLSTFVLSGLGAYLLVRELTGSVRAAFVAGLVFAFAPYRIGQFTHVQVLSSQWMPFALYGFRRYFAGGRLPALAGGTVALVMQNLSCGYFLLYFSPFIALYVVYELVDRGAWRQWRMVAASGVAGLFTFAIAVPFLLPRLDLRARGFAARPFGEVVHYSADVYSYLTAHGAQRVWGEVMRAFPKPEGDLFPSLVPVVLALAGVILHVARVWHGAGAAGTGTRVAQIGGTGERDAAASSTGHPQAAWRRYGSWLALALLISQAVAVVLILLTAGVTLPLGVGSLRVQNTARALRVAAVAAIALLALSPRARRVARGTRGSTVAFYTAAALLAFWMSLGPIVESMGSRVAGDGLYGWFFLHVPGFDGLRVPARMGMLVALFLAVLAGYGCAAIERRWRAGGAVVVAAGALFLVESTAAPIGLNGVSGSEGLRTPPAEVLTGDRVPPVYRFVRSLPAGTVLAEFPFGDDQYELRYMFYSTVHWRPLVNGYSGGFPVSYIVNKAALGRVLQDPRMAWIKLAQSGATHAIVHAAAYLDDDGARVSAWLKSHGARLVGSFGPDHVFELPLPARQVLAAAARGQAPYPLK